jgi:predicted regulator of Ras-like GTPase activity (Roadblock/LC7/MglB family)
VPNEVFLRTRTGLSAFVSSRAAGRILEGALKGSGHSPDDVDPTQMTITLLGPVLRELEAVLPRAGLRRNLEKLARSIRSPETTGKDRSGDQPGPAGHPEHEEHAGTGPAATTPAVTEPSAGAVEAPADTRWPQVGGGLGAGEPAAGDSVTAMTESDAPGHSAPDAQASTGSDAAAPVAAGGSPARAGVGASGRVPLRRALSAEELDSHVNRFAQIEHVRLVVVIRQDGSVAASLGDGPDLALLARISRLALTLLAKGGTVRQVHLGHTEGQLFLFPFGSDLLVVFGGVELNLGTVTTAFTALALEEES